MTTNAPAIMAAKAPTNIAVGVTTNAPAIDNNNNIIGMTTNAPAIMAAKAPTNTAAASKDATSIIGMTTNAPAIMAAYGQRYQELGELFHAFFSILLVIIVIIVIILSDSMLVVESFDPSPSVRVHYYTPLSVELGDSSVPDTALIARLVASFNDLALTNRSRPSAGLFPLPQPATKDDILPLLRSHAPPDVLPLPAHLFGIASDDLFVSLADIWASSGLESYAFRSVRRRMESSVAADPDLVAVPLEVSADVCMYSSRTIAALGIDSPPNTLDDLIDACIIARAADLICLSVTSPTLLFDYLALRSHGTEFYALFVAANVSLTDPRVVHTFDDVLRLIDIAAIGPYTLLASPALVSGSSLFHCGPSSRAGEFASYTSDLAAFAFPSTQSVFATRPELEPAKLGLIGSVSGLAAAARSPFRDSAHAFLAHCAHPAVLHAALAPLPHIVSPRFDVATLPNATVAATVTTLLRNPRLASLQHASSRTGFGDPRLATEWIALHSLLLASSSVANATHALDIALPRLDALRLAYVFNKAAVPIASLSSGTYSAPIELTLSTFTPGSKVTIYYAIDSETAWKRYVGPIVLSASGVYIVHAHTVVRTMTPSDRLSVTLNLIDSPNPSRATDLPVYVIILIVVAVLVCVFGLVLIAVSCARRFVCPSASVGSMASLLVVDVDDLVFDSLLGKTALGDVYLGRIHGTPVTMHLTAPTKLPPTEAERLVVEVVALAGLDHPNLTGIIGVSTSPTVIIYEFTPRASLRDVIHTHTLTIDSSMVFKWAFEMAAALAFLARNHTLHGNFSSLCVHFDADWTVKVSQFGLHSIHAIASSPLLSQSCLVTSASVSHVGPPQPSATIPTRSSRDVSDESGDDSPGLRVSVTASAVSVSELEEDVCRLSSSASEMQEHSESDFMVSQVQSSPSFASRTEPRTAMSSSRLISSESLVIAEGPHTPSRAAGGKALPSTAPAATPTLFWTAPEVLASGRSLVSTSSDAYSLAIVLWELTTRAQLYQGLNPVAVALDVMHVARRPPIAAVPPLYGPIAPVIELLWRGSPTDRLTIDAATHELGHLVHPESFTFPASITVPPGVAHVVHCELRNAARLLLSNPQAAHRLLTAFHAVIPQLARSDGAIISAWGINWITLTFKWPPDIVSFAEAVGAHTAIAEPVTIMAVKAKVATTLDSFGHPCLSGPAIDALAVSWNMLFGSVVYTILAGISASAASAMASRLAAPSALAWEHGFSGGLFVDTVLARNLGSSAKLVHVVGSVVQIVIKGHVSVHDIAEPTNLPSGTVLPALQASRQSTRMRWSRSSASPHRSRSHASSSASPHRPSDASASGVVRVDKRFHAGGAHMTRTTPNGGHKKRRARRVHTRRVRTRIKHPTAATDHRSVKTGSRMRRATAHVSKDMTDAGLSATAATTQADTVTLPIYSEADGTHLSGSSAVQGSKSSSSSRSSLSPPSMTCLPTPPIAVRLQEPSNSHSHSTSLGLEALMGTTRTVKLDSGTSSAEESPRVAMTTSTSILSSSSSTSSQDTIPACTSHERAAVAANANSETCGSSSLVPSPARLQGSSSSSLSSFSSDPAQAPPTTLPDLFFAEENESVGAGSSGSSDRSGSLTADEEHESVESSETPLGTGIAGLNRTLSVNNLVSMEARILRREDVDAVLAKSGVSQSPMWRTAYTTAYLGMLSPAMVNLSMPLPTPSEHGTMPHSPSPGSRPSKRVVLETDMALQNSPALLGSHMFVPHPRDVATASMSSIPESEQEQAAAAAAATAVVPVVVKVLERQSATPMELMNVAEALATASNYARTSRRLVGPLAFCLDIPRLAYIERLYPGQSLAQLLALPAPPPSALAAVARGMVRSLMRLYAAQPRERQGHGALRPSNVLLVVTDSVPRAVVDAHISGFGLASLQTMTSRATVLPLVQYLAPEQIRGEVQQSVTSDVFILGSILYEMASGFRAFDGSDPLEVSVRISAGLAPDPEPVSIPSSRLRNLIASCWATSPEQRPSIAEVTTIVTSCSPHDFARGAHKPVASPSPSDHVV
ncbi:TKL protein kinase [Thecamonas trahens ATCC 50062]|uniref:TKL protein kinase n=1 Tax=Thecamonas trahens ATCC 50062 TaxID=461836 RepID=A0A0L0DU02_THETB|nr:TKL protein kinase [Thecamonas trahens ATCC 50062]KNC55735.1 TKL protein kinase [Thecamonas trahens ATCC 50062]|eukprot:XP_013752889.1 TKL protein kinase [Thecamonas trahens ATCC 50062]